MRTTTRWVLGIVIGLVLVAALAAIAYLAFTRWGGSGWLGDARGLVPEFAGRARPEYGMRVLPFWGAPAFWFGGFSPIRMIAGWLIWLGLLALIVLAVIALLRSLSGRSQAAAAQVPPASPAAAPAQTCPNCGRPVQADWRHCPNCGNALQVL